MPDKQHWSWTEKSSWALEIENSKVTKWVEESSLSSRRFGPVYALKVIVWWRGTRWHHHYPAQVATTCTTRRLCCSVSTPWYTSVFLWVQCIKEKGRMRWLSVTPWWPDLFSKCPKWKPLPGLNLKELRRMSPGLISAHGRCACTWKNWRLSPSLSCTHGYRGPAEDPRPLSLKCLDKPQNKP